MGEYFPGRLLREFCECLDLVVSLLGELQALFQRLNKTVAFFSDFVLNIKNLFAKAALFPFETCNLSLQLMLLFQRWRLPAVLNLTAGPDNPKGSKIIQVINEIPAYISQVFRLTEAQIIDLVAFSTIFAIGGSIFSGFISDYIGYRRSLMGVFFLWAACLLGGAFLRPPFHWLIGAIVGISLGSTWVISRAIVIKLVPREKIGEIFGLFNLVSYISAIVGPLFWGIIILYFSSFGEWGYRMASLSMIPFIGVAFIFLLRLRKN